MINVTKAYLPSKIKYHAYIDEIYEKGWLTNNGGLQQRLQTRLAEYLGVKHVICLANGSLALQVAYKALDLKGEVITTPFSFIATASTLQWEKLTPVFADIEPSSFNIDHEIINLLITDNTSAIVPVHVFGNPCKVDMIQELAKRHKLKVIYDASHAFGVKYNGESILNYGDISTLSFHATKLFHTIEGGAIVTNDDDVAAKAKLLINFGITGPNSIKSEGTNAKMNEFEAAMGLCILDEIEDIKTERSNIWEKYYNELVDKVQFQLWNVNSGNNHAYAPVLFKTEEELLKVENELRRKEIIPRRYFYPSLDTIEHFKSGQHCIVSRDIASRILCLPIYPGLTKDEQANIINVLKESL
ncbi:MULTISPECIES: DegT/DnrJ/EryC1/StrS family aminotransferase [unclassified Halomonas]|uniref:DegT/DnrJ/EryC1/StrS family aminotransferase n=1 Tax=unclassified Halomonas TaxID=2609666 RepID=UPI00048154D3|nr:MULTISPECIES: DegT/DnrJ/EryC1/StrS family aminotransferase [unclassified Halomonas]